MRGLGPHALRYRYGNRGLLSCILLDRFFWMLGSSIVNVRIPGQADLEAHVSRMSSGKWGLSRWFEIDQEVEAQQLVLECRR